MSRALLLPTYLPNIAAFAVMAQVNHLLMEIHDNYQKQSYRNRTYINTANGRLTLSIPVKHVSGSGHKKTKDASIENNFLWQRQHWRSIQIAYRSSPFFEFYEQDLQQLYETEFENLTDFNLRGIRVLMELIEISPEITMTKSYEKSTPLPDYRDWAVAKMHHTPIEIPNYHQVFDDKHEFNAEVSVIDVLFNLGPQTKEYLQSINL